MSESKKPRDECIEWQGKLAPNGYGNLGLGNTTIGVHRLAWALANGRMPLRGMDICHSCDNRKCINPAHLFEGTRKDNMQDAVRKGRMVVPFRLGDDCRIGHKLSPENVIRRSDGARRCRTCEEAFQKRRRVKQAEARRKNESR